MEGVKAKRKEANHRYRLKNESKIQEQDKERKMLWRLRQKCSKDKEAYEEHKRKDRERKRLKKQANTAELPNTESPGSSQPVASATTPESAFRYKSTKMRSLVKAAKALPSTPRRQSEVVVGLAKKLNINVGAVDKKKSSPAKVELSDDETQWLVSKTFFVPFIFML